MEPEKYSTKQVINKSITSCNGVYKKLLVSSFVQYVAFLVAFVLTQSFLISFITYLVFLPSQVKFLADLKNENVDNVFKVRAKFGSYLLLSMFFTFLFGLLGILLIFPAVIFFANYGLVFEVAAKENLSLTDSLKRAKEKVYGYRGKMAWLCVIFMFILILLVGFCMLVSWLLSLVWPMMTQQIGLMLGLIWIPSFYFVGAFCGISLFLIFVLPIELICLTNVPKAIEADKLYIEAHPEEKSEEPKEEKMEEQAKEEVKADEEKDDSKPSDYIS